MWVEVHEKLLKMQSTPEVDCTFFNVWSSWLRHHELIHYLAFHDDHSLVLLHCTADGYQVTLMPMPLHGTGGDQSIYQVNNNL
jgi:hypothetical protein